MAQKPAQIDTPNIPLKACSVAEHCQALREIGGMPFWWYVGTSRIFGNFSVPFQGGSGVWWYQVKPGLCWPVDCFVPMDPTAVRLSWRKSFLGYQHVVAEEKNANSRFVINAIRDLPCYGIDSINSKRRNAVRKGFRNVDLAVLAEYDAETFEQCRMAWGELTQRTGWKHAAEKETFETSWRLLLDCPGVSVVVGREKESGQVAGFLVTKVIGDTAYVDTIASRTEFLRTNVNDAMMYAFLINAQRIKGVRKAHYAIRSYDTTLEKFKTGLGFDPHPFPSRTRLRGLTGWLMKRFRRSDYRRMHGQFDDEA